MRELEYSIIRAFRAGLRPYAKSARDDSGLLEARNTRVGPLGLEPLVPVARYATFARSWPFPQFIDTDGEDQFVVVRGAVSDTLYSLDGGGAVTKLADFAQGTRLEMADFQNYRVFSNGVGLVQQAPSGLTVGIAASTIPLFRTACAFNGQCLLGNITSSWYDCDASSVVWSAIGSIDFTPGRSNVAGFAKTGGEVYGLRKYGERVVVYGSKHIDTLIPVSEPAPTFGRRAMLPVGLAGRYAFAGDETTQVFVDEAGWLWRLEGESQYKSSSLPPQRLGYQEFMTRMTASDIVVSFDRVRRDFVISDGRHAFLLSPHGLSETHQAVSGMLRSNGALVGDYEDLGRHPFRAQTDTIDLGYRGAKTLFTHEYGGDGTGKMDLSIEWRNDRSEEFRLVGPSPLNKEGVATLIVSGTEFRFVLEAGTYEGVAVNYLKTRFKMTDLRSLRGIYAPPPRGQSDQ